MADATFADRWAQRPRAAGAGRLADLETALARIPLFADVAKRHVRALARVARIASYPVGAEIVRQGTEGDTLFVLLEGDARVVKRGRRIARLRPGDFFGELAIIDGEPRAATVVADEPARCLKLEGSDFRKLLLREPRLGLAVMTGLAQRLRDSSRR